MPKQPLFSMSTCKMKDVRDYYDHNREAEDARLESHSLEMPHTLHYIRKYVPQGARILDLACGTGHYAKVLAADGYRLGLNDLSPANTELCAKRLGSNPAVEFIHTGDARGFPFERYQKWGAILLLGPLYHMRQAERRLSLLKSCREALVPGGMLYSAFMSRAGALVFGIKHKPEAIISGNNVQDLWNKGHDDAFTEGTETFVHAQFDHPAEVNGLIRKAGLECLHLAGMEGVFGERFGLFNSLGPGIKEKWLEFVIRNGEDPAMLHASKHLLSVAQKHQAS